MKSPRNHPAETDLLIPAPLRPGDIVGVAAPAGPPRSDWLKAGVDFLRSHEFEVVLGANIHKQSAYLAGTDQQRADDFNAMLRDPSVRAILLARGGYGTMRILRLLDLNALKEDPIIICGMSDGTALQLYLYRHLGLITLSGPMIAAQVGQRLDSWTAENFLKGLRARWQGADIFRDERLDLRIARHGRCVGPLLGGCLSLVTALLGTHCLPKFS
ncbi:MAG: muramoyltetrapeptide carboxypeptidase, partial [Thermodesulfobacteriota bacterium]|nr:muramoyltetrapeptide carboxypeptidase [Thermodesulfobacteriota bacterium]